MNKTQAVIVGEVLFDVFDGQKEVLGGAPFNVAWHLQGLGHSPVLISRVGQDKLGERILQTMQEWGMTTTAMQIDAQHATGVVNVILRNGQPSFEICENVAYDHIDIQQADQSLDMSSIPVLYHGSLAARTRAVYDTLLQFRQAASRSFVDINLRPPWWEQDIVYSLMRQADWLKVNDDELVTLTGCQADRNSLIDSARDLMQGQDIEHLILTLGADGALIITAEDVHQSPPVQVENIVDTVGAGDAFSAVCIFGMMEAWPIPDILQRATEFAARICQQQGATSLDHAMYEHFREKWQIN